MIQFKNAHIGYTERLFAIEDLNLQAGQIYILAGRNGAGKSTLFKTITKQIELLSGEILINNESIAQLKEKDIAKTLAFVETKFPSADFLRVSEFVALGRIPHTNALGRLTPRDTEAIDAALAILEIEHLRDKFTSELSDGEGQLVAIARAFAQESPIVLLDEPTAYLDYANKSLVLERLKNSAKTLGKCVILSSHDIDLSIEASCPFMIVTTEKSLVYLEAPVQKENILNLAFGII